MREIFFAQRHVRARRRRAISPARSTCSRARGRPVANGPRAQGHVSAARPRGRERLPIRQPAAARCAGCPKRSRSATPRPASTAAPRVSVTGWPRLACSGVRADGHLRRGLRGRGPRHLHELSRDGGAAARRQAPRGATSSSGRSADSRTARGHGDVRVEPPPGVTVMTRNLPAGPVADAGHRAPDARAEPFSNHTPHRAGADWRRSSTTPTVRTRIEIAPSRLATTDTYVEFQGTHRVRRPVADPVSRHERRLAGERPSARRHHDRLRRRGPTRSRSAVTAPSTAS